jgi:hypothetical protein
MWCPMLLPISASKNAITKSVLDQICEPKQTSFITYPVCAITLISTKNKTNTEPHKSLDQDVILNTKHYLFKISD